MPKTILIVDDSASLPTVIKLALARDGYDVIEAANGLEGVARLEMTGKVHLILGDVNMPDMDGIAFVEHVKAHPRHGATPVIMLGTAGQDARKEQARSAGAKAWFTKPFNTSQLLGAVGKLVLP